MLPTTTRIWIYQSSRPFAPSEEVNIVDQLSRFTAQWAAHGVPLHATAQVLYNRFIIIAVDTAHHAPSGCSIDASIHFLKDLEKQYQFQLFDRLTIAYKQPDGSVHTLSRDEFIRFYQQGNITPETIVFDNTVQTLADWEQRWEIPLRQSWHIRLVQVSSR